MEIIGTAPVLILMALACIILMYYIFYIFVSPIYLVLNVIIGIILGKIIVLLILKSGIIANILQIIKGL